MAQCKIPTIPESLQYLEKTISKYIQAVIHLSSFIFPWNKFQNWALGEESGILAEA